MKRTIPDCLDYADALGHVWHYTTIDPATGKERACLHTNDGESCFRSWKQDEGTPGQWQIYRRKRRGWEWVSPSLASIS